MNPSSPRSIDDYLTRLRAALAGADPALIQDALYDAEEYMRVEVAANRGSPRRTCSNLLPAPTARRTKSRRLIATRKRGSKRRCSRRGPEGLSRRTAGSVFHRVFRLARVRVAVLHVARLVTGGRLFHVRRDGSSLSLGLAILIIGLPVFLGFIGIARVISLGEGRLLEAVSGERMPRRPVHPGAPDGLVARIARDAEERTDVDDAHLLLVMLPLGIVYFVIAVTGLSVGVSFLFAPVVDRAAPRLGALGYARSIMFSPALINTPWWLRCRIRRRRPDDAPARGARSG